MLVLGYYYFFFTSTQDYWVTMVTCVRICMSAGLKTGTYQSTGVTVTSQGPCECHRSINLSITRCISRLMQGGGRGRPHVLERDIAVFELLLRSR